MKNHVFILIIFLLTLTVGHGQTNIYHPFPDSAFWRVDEYYDQPFQFECFINDYFQYYSSGDTLINSYVHKKIYKSYTLQNIPYCNPNLPPPSGPPNPGYVGALKDDSLANKVSFVFPNSTTDSLLYDYNLIVGDTMKGHISESVWGSSHLVVLSIDSVLINGKYRKRWNFDKDDNNDSTYFIEGIGSSGGLIEPLNTYAVDFTYRHLVCVKNSLGILFTSAYNSVMGCNLIVEGINEINIHNKVNCYPNPFSTQVTFQTDKVLNDATLKVYNSFGQQVKQIINISGQTLTFHRDNLPSGLYFLQLIEDNKIFSTDKLIIIDN